MQTLERKRSGKPGYWATHKYERRAVIDLDGRSFIGWDQLIRLIEAANARDRYNPYDFAYCSSRDKGLIATVFLTGCRIGEAVMLRRSMFQIDDSWIYCTKVPLLKRWRYVGKKKKRQTKSLPATRDFVFPRYEPLTDYMIYMIEQTNDYLFPSKFHRYREHLSGIRGWQIIDGLAKRIGWSCWSHRLRSERASQLASEYGWRTEDLMRFFGWKTAKEAIRYVHESIEDMKSRFPLIQIKDRNRDTQPNIKT